MFEDVRAAFPGISLRKKRFKFCNLEIYGNLQSFAK